MTRCPEQKIYTPHSSLMMAVNTNPHREIPRNRPMSSCTHDSSDYSQTTPHLQMLKHTMFGDSCAQVNRTENELDMSESDPGNLIFTNSEPPSWITRACRGLWEQISLQFHDSKLPDEGSAFLHLSGSELITGLVKLSGKIDRLLATGVWQLLYEEGAVSQVHCSSLNSDRQREFVDKSDVLYQCTCSLQPGESELHEPGTIMEDNACADELRFISSSAPDDKIKTSSSPVPLKLMGLRMDSLELDESTQTEDRFQLLIERLYGLASDALFRRILLKQPSMRSPKEIDFVFHELHLVPALSRLSRNVRHELSRCLLYEIHTKTGTTVFNQGDPGTSWYIIHRGSVWVYVKGQGHVCRLSEGDDFGKLALVTGAPRAASIVLAEDNCHFLKVEKNDFDRILRDVEANIVRLREKDSDVLILERLLGSEVPKSSDNVPLNKADIVEKKSPTPGRFIDHSIVAGTTEKIVQHLLDLRLGGLDQRVSVLLDAETTPICLCPQLITNVDQVFEDFILTYTLFTTDKVLFDLLMSYAQSGISSDIRSTLDVVYVNRVLVFLYCWCQCLGLALFTKTDNLPEFFNRLQDFINTHFSESVQSQVLSRLVMECKNLLFDNLECSNYDRTKKPQVNENLHGLSAPPLSGMSATRPTSIRRSSGSRMRFGRHRQSYRTADAQGRSTTVAQSTGHHRRSTESVCGSSCADSYPPVLPNCSFSPNKLPFTDRHHMIRFPVYLEVGRKQHWLTMQLNCTVADIKQEMAKYLSEKGDLNCFRLVEVSSKGERVIFDDCERGVVLGLSPNSCLFMVAEDKVKSLAPLPVQLAVAMNFLEHHELERHRSNQDLHHKDLKPSSPLLRRMASTGMNIRALDELSIDEVATVLTMTSIRVAACIGPRELIEYTLGAKKSNSAAAHVRLLVNHFSLIHTWTITQVVTSTNVNRRAQLVKKLIKIADRLIDAPFYDQHTCFAIVLGLHSSPVARLSHTWERVPMRWRRVYLNRLVPLIDPARNHRAARTWVTSAQTPHLPFLALILKDLRFAEDANQTYYPEQSGTVRLINFDKMRLVAQSLRLWNRAMSGYDWVHPQAARKKSTITFDGHSDCGLLQKVQDVSVEHLHLFFENLECIDDIRMLTQLSLRLEPKRC